MVLAGSPAAGWAVACQGGALYLLNVLLPETEDRVSRAPSKTAYEAMRAEVQNSPVVIVIILFFRNMRLVLTDIGQLVTTLGYMVCYLQHLCLLFG